MADKQAIALTGFQVGLIRASTIGRLWLDTWYLAAYLQVNNAGDAGDAVDVSPDVAGLMAARMLWHEPFDVDAPPEMRQPRFVHYHPTERGEDVLMAGRGKR